MQKIVALCILLAFSGSAFGQKHKKDEADNQPVKENISATNSPVPQDTVYMRMYHNGMKYGDYRIAITALHSLYAIHPDKIGYLDSLCLLYAQTENYAQCIFTGRQVLKSLPNDLGVISSLAIAEQQLGRYKESLEMYELEYSKNSSLYAAYQIAVLQYSLKRYGEAQASLDHLLLKPEALKEKISFSAGSNTSQLVLYKAAGENLMGIVYEDLKDFEMADAHFKKAIEIQPDFVLAQNNLENLKKLRDPDKEDTNTDKKTPGPENKKIKKTK